MIFERTLGLLVFLGLFVAVPAQAADNPQEEPIEFRAIGWNREIMDMFYEVKGKAQPLPLYRRRPSLPQRYVGSPVLVFYVPVIVDGKRKKAPVAEVTLKEPPYKNLVVIWLGKNGRYVASVLADEPDSPPPGNLRFVNLSGQNLAVKCTGQDQFLLPAGTEKIVAPYKGGVGVGVKVARQVSGTESWELALMNGISVKAHERVTAFIADPSRLALSPEEEAQGPNFQPDPLNLFLIRDRVASE